MDSQLRRLINGWTGISKLFSKIDCDGQYQYVLEAIEETKMIRDDRGLTYLNGLVHMLTLLAKEYEAETGIVVSRPPDAETSASFLDRIMARMVGPAEILPPIPDDVFDFAVRVLGSEPEALTWLNESNRTLGGEKPAIVAQTEEGVKQVKDLLGQIEYGIFP